MSRAGRAPTVRARGEYWAARTTRCTKRRTTAATAAVSPACRSGPRAGHLLATPFPAAPPLQGKGLKHVARRARSYGARPGGVLGRADDALYEAKNDGRNRSRIAGL